MVTCEICDKELTSRADIEVDACLECDEYRCSNCGEEYDVEYSICGCGESKDHATADLLADRRQGK